MTIKRMKQRRGTAAAWTAADPILASGEIGYETNSGKLKIGDGVTTWAGLSYFTGGGAGTGDVSGPVSSTDHAIVRFNGALGKTIQNSVVTIDDSGSPNIPTGQTYNINNVPHTHAGSVVSGSAIISDGGTIAHGLSGVPKVWLQATISGETVTPSVIDGTNITVAIKTNLLEPGTTQTVYWMATL